MIKDAAADFAARAIAPIAADGRDIQRRFVARHRKT